MSSIHVIGDFSTLIFMALALGMDVFSASIGMGMQTIRLRRIMVIGFIFGAFHIVLPFIGIILGQLLSHKVGTYTSLAGGILLVGVGAQMIFGAFHKADDKIMQPYGIGLYFLALSVSVDSFSVGLGLGISGVKVFVTLLMFGSITVLMAWIGMLIGRKVRGILGVYSEILGGSILFSFGIYIIFG